MRLAIVSALAALAAATASAETDGDCGNVMSRMVYDTVQSARAGTITLDAATGNFDEAADECPENAWGQHYAALGHWTRATTLNTAQAGNDAVFAEIEKAFSASQAFWAMEDHSQGFPVQLQYRTDTIKIPYEEASNLRTDIMKALLNYHAFAGKSHPYITSADPPAGCTDNMFWDVSAVRSWYTDHPDAVVFAYSLAKKWASACPLKNAGGGVQIVHDVVQSIRMSYADKVAGADEGLMRQLVAEIRAFRDAAISHGEAYGYYWHDYDASKLERFEAMLPAIVSIPTDKESPLVSAGTVPLEEWFLEATDGQRARESIGETINAYVAAEGPNGFVSVIGKIFVLTKTASDPHAAQQMVYWVAFGYDKGHWRTSDTKDVKVFDAAYKWLKDYKGE